MTMIKRMLFAIGVLCIGSWCYGQSAVQFLNTNAEKLPFDNLWMANYSHENNMGDVVSVDLELRKNGRLVYRATSNPIVLTSRFQVLNPKQSGLEKETFLDAQIGMFIRNSNTLPSGSYAACIVVESQEVSTGNSPEIRSCIEFSIELDSRLRLTHIPNGQEVSKNELPMFIWSFLSPSVATSEVQYTLTVSEILEGQSKEEAILRNMPLLVEKGLLASSFQYPIDAQGLKEDKKYAWCVQANASDLLLATSEVWGFSVEGTTEKKENSVSMPYLDLEELRSNELVNIKGDKFNIKIDYSLKGTRELSFEIVDAKGRSLKPSLAPLEISYGSNYLSLDLAALKKLKVNHEYELIITGLEESDLKVNFLYLEL